jgi:hypothetical protein
LTNDYKQIGLAWQIKNVAKKCLFFSTKFLLCKIKF